MHPVHALRRLYWRIFQPITLGCRCLIVSQNRVLLVHHTYESWWYLPGGGVKKGESFVEAARREVQEECGVEVGDLKLFHLYFNRREGKNDHVALFVTTDVRGTPRADGEEIAAVAFAPLDDLPERTSPATRRRIAEYLGAAPADRW